MTAGGRSMAGCLERVAMACGLRAVNARPWRLEAEIADRVRGTHGLLIVDEAQHLDTRALEVLRGLHDQAGIGLALMGNEIALCPPDRGAPGGRVRPVVLPGGQAGPADPSHPG